MDITIARADLARALTTVGRVVEKRTTIAILSHVLIDADAGVLTVRGTDLDVIMTAKAPANVITHGRVCVDAARLVDIARKMAGADVIMVLAGDKLTVKSGRSRFVLSTLPATDFPDFKEGEFDAMFKTDLAALFAPCQFAMSTEETRYYLNGTYLHVLDDKLCAVATDGHKLSFHEGPCPDGAAGMPGVIVPTKAILATPKGDVTVSVSASKIRIEADDTVLVSKLVDGTFPDYRRAMPAGNDKRVGVNRADLQAALERVACVTSEMTRAAKLTIDGDTLRVDVMDAAAGSGTDEVPIDYDGEPLTIGFNYRYLGEVLAALTGDTATMHLADPGSPGLFTGAGTVQCVCMPMWV